MGVFSVEANQKTFITRHHRLWVSKIVNYSNTDGSFTVDGSNSFLNPKEILPI